MNHWLRILVALVALAEPGAETGTRTMPSTTGSGVRIERLGTVSPVSNPSSWRHSSALEPMPIVLWRGTAVAAALY